jgi:ABC-type transporter MlaC component
MKNRSKRMKQDVIAAMRAADMPPQLIYAYDRTGFLLLEEGYKNLSPEDKAEYDSAIDEYFAKKKAK